MQTTEQMACVFRFSGTALRPGVPTPTHQSPREDALNKGRAGARLTGRVGFGGESAKPHSPGKHSVVGPEQGTGLGDVGV